MPLPPSGQPSTLPAYRTELRRLLHDATGKFWSDAELNDYINAGRFRVCADTGCIRSLVSTYLSTGLEQYVIGGVTGGLVTNAGTAYSHIAVTVVGDGTGAQATATLLPSTTGIAGGGVSGIRGFGGFQFSGAPPAVTLTGDGTGATATAYFALSTNDDFLSVASPGTGYKVGDLLLPLGGIAVSAGFVIVTSIGVGGAVTAVSTATPGMYLSAPALGATATAGGHGFGCTVNLDFQVLAVVTSPGSGYTTCTVGLSANATGFGAAFAGVVAPLTASAGGLAQVVVTNPGLGYSQATFQFSGDGFGAAATATIIPNNTLDILNVSPIWGNQRPPCNYQPWTEFNAKTRLILANPQMPRVWSRYGSSGGSAFLGPIPNQPYPCEFDTAILPLSLASDAQVDQIQFPYTSPVCYYAAWKAKLKQQAVAEAESFLGDYKREVMFAQASVMMRRVPNPYAGYTGG